MQDNTQLTITTQETVSIFNGLTVSIIISDQGKMYVPIRQLASHFVSKPDTQVTSVKSDSRFNYLNLWVVQKEGKREVKRLTACLPLEEVAAFIYGLNIKLIHPELRNNLLYFQRVTVQVIDDFWRKEDSFYKASIHELLMARPKWKKILRYRQLGLSQRDIGKLLGVTQRCIWGHLARMKQCGLITSTGILVSKN